MNFLIIPILLLLFATPMLIDIVELKKKLNEDEITTYQANKIIKAQNKINYFKKNHISGAIPNLQLSNFGYFTNEQNILINQFQDNIEEFLNKNNYSLPTECSDFIEEHKIELCNRVNIISSEFFIHNANNNTLAINNNINPKIKSKLQKQEVLQNNQIKINDDIDLKIQNKLEYKKLKSKIQKIQSNNQLTPQDKDEILNKLSDTIKLLEEKIR